MKIIKMPDAFQGTTTAFGLHKGMLFSDDVTYDGNKIPFVNKLKDDFLDPKLFNYAYPNDMYPAVKNVCNINFGSYYSGYNADMVSCGGTLLEPFESTKGITAGKTFYYMGGRETISDDGETIFCFNSDSANGSTGSTGTDGYPDYNIKFSKILFETEELIVGVAYNKAYRDITNTYGTSNIVAVRKNDLTGKVLLHANLQVEYLGESASGDHYLNLVIGYIPSAYKGLSPRRHYLVKFNESTLILDFFWGYIFAYGNTTRKVTFGTDLVSRNLDENGFLTSCKFIKSEETGHPKTTSDTLTITYCSFDCSTETVTENQNVVLPITTTMTSDEGSSLFVVGKLESDNIKLVICKGDGEIAEELPVYKVTGSISENTISDIDIVAIDSEGYSPSNVLLDRDTMDVWLFDRKLLSSGSGFIFYVSTELELTESFSVDSIYGFGCEKGIGYSIGNGGGNYSKTIYVPSVKKCNISISLDKSHYEKGDTAIATITSNLDGTVNLDVLGGTFTNGKRTIPVIISEGTATTEIVVDSSISVTAYSFKEI